MDISEFMQTVATFSDFTQAELEVLEKAFRVDRFPAEHVFVREGEKSRTLYLVMEGEVNVSRRKRHDRGYEYKATLTPGDLFGLQSLVDNHPRLTTCRAASAVTVASLPQSAFNLLYHSHISIAEHFQYLVARQLVRDLRRLDRRLTAALGHAEDTAADRPRR